MFRVSKRAKKKQNLADILEYFGFLKSPNIVTDIDLKTPIYI